MENYRIKKKLNKILDFLETFPEIEFIKNNHHLSNAATEAVLDFLELKPPKNYKYYPWLEKIMEKKIELFGIFPIF